MQKIFPVVVGIIKEGEKIYLQMRKKPGHPTDGFWELPGGNIEFGEAPEDALIREVKEETNFDIVIEKLLPQIFSNVWMVADGKIQVLLIAYVCRVGNGEHQHEEMKASDGQFMELHKIDYAKCLPLMKEMIELATIKT